MHKCILFLAVWTVTCTAQSLQPVRVPEILKAGNPDVIKIDDLPSELDVLIADAKRGSAKEQFLLGYAYLTGLQGVKKNEAEAVVWLQKSAAQGNSDAQYNLGVCYQFHLGVSGDLSVALDFYRKAAEQGHPFAQNSLGTCYLKGIGVKRDDNEAVKWYLKAAHQGEPFAEANLGLCYSNGLGVDKDSKVAFDWYLKSAKHGNADAQTATGNNYRTGAGTAKNITEALTWYKKAAEQNNADSQYALGVIYSEGEVVEQDHTAAFLWYNKAAAKGHASSQAMVGVYYESGEAVTKDMRLALSWYLKSAEQGNPYGQFRYGVLILNGANGETNIPSARPWIKKAADQGFTEAEAVLAGALYDEKNMELASQYARKASEKGNHGATYVLGLCLIASKDEVQRNEGKRHLLTSAGQGFAPAQTITGQLYLTDFMGKKNPQEAVKWFKKAADQGDAQALFSLGGCYLNGDGVIKDEIEAYALFNVAGITNEKAREVLKIFETLLTTEARLVGQQRAKQLQKDIESKKAAAEGRAETLKQLLKEAENERRRKGA